MSSTSLLLTCLLTKDQWDLLAFWWHTVTWCCSSLHGTEETAPTHGLMEDTRGKKNHSFKTTGRTPVTDLHQATHLGSTKISELLWPRYVIPRRGSLACLSQMSGLWASKSKTENTYSGMGLSKRLLSRWTLGKLTSPRSSLWGRMQLPAGFFFYRYLFFWWGGWMGRSIPHLDWICSNSNVKAPPQS